MNAKMRIVILNTYDIQGGAARSAWGLHSGLQRLGHESTMLCLNKASQDASVEKVVVDTSKEACAEVRLHDDIFRYGIFQHRTPLSNTHFSLSLSGYDVSRHPLVRAADVIHLHWVDGLLSPEAIRALQQLGKPLVWTLHDQRPFTGGCHFSAGCHLYADDCGSCPQLTPAFEKVPRYCLQRMLKLVDVSNILVVSPSRWLAECARRSALFRKSRVEVVPYGLDVDVFKPMVRSQARELLGLPASGMYFLFGAHNIMERRKGIQIFLEAVQLCLKDRDFADAVASGAIKFLCFGNIPPEFDFIGLPVICLGLLEADEKVAAAYAAANVFVCSTLEDNLPNTIMESMSCGTPVLASRVGGVPDLVSDGHDGAMFEAGNGLALSVAMCKAARQPMVLDAWGEAARATVLEKFPLATQALRYVELYREVITPASSFPAAMLPPTQTLPLMPANCELPPELRRQTVGAESLPPGSERILSDFQDAQSELWEALSQLREQTDEVRRLKKTIKHLRKIIQSAENWQKRSWFRRAFHRWRAE